MKLKVTDIIFDKSIRTQIEVDDLIKSIEKEGLLQPIVIDQDRKLICGRRRLEAIKQLGWKDVVVYQIKTADDIDRLSKAIVENICRRDLTWQEEIRAKEELDKLMRLKYGEHPRHRIKKSSESDELWSYDKTAKLLNQASGVVREDIQLSKALEDYPELTTAPNKSIALKMLKKIKQTKARNKMIENLPSIKNLILGDAIEELLKLKDNTVDCVITDPPYGINLRTNRRVIPDVNIKPITGDNESSALILLNKSLEILYKKTKEDAHIYIFTSWKLECKFRDIISKYYKIKNVLIWDKGIHGVGDLEGDYGEVYEMIIYATNGRRMLNSPRPINILRYNKIPAANLLHPAQKPIELLEFLISKSTIENELVVDPFAGVGSTLIAAKRLGRRFWGCEIDKQYYDIALGNLQ